MPSVAWHDGPWAHKVTHATHRQNQFYINQILEKEVNNLVPRAFPDLNPITIVSLTTYKDPVSPQNDEKAEKATTLSIKNVTLDTLKELAHSKSKR